MEPEHSTLDITGPLPRPETTTTVFEQEETTEIVRVSGPRLFIL